MVKGLTFNILKCVLCLLKINALNALEIVFNIQGNVYNIQSFCTASPYVYFCGLNLFFYVEDLT